MESSIYLFESLAFCKTSSVISAPSATITSPLSAVIVRAAFLPKSIVLRLSSTADLSLGIFFCALGRLGCAGFELFWLACARLKAAFNASACWVTFGVFLTESSLSAAGISIGSSSCSDSTVSGSEVSASSTSSAEVSAGSLKFSSSMGVMLSTSAWVADSSDSEFSSTTSEVSAGSTSTGLGFFFPLRSQWL